MAHDDRFAGRAPTPDGVAPDRAAPAPAPGRATLTARLAPRLASEVQRRAAADQPAAPRATAIGADASWRALFDVLAPAAPDDDTTRTIASRGVAGAGGELPHRAQLQASFGRHAPALGGVRAHVGGDAATASRAIGADAYATGGAVAFTSSPDLHLAAHEAAHVVQQRAGVSLSGGVGAAGDPYEAHADRVADAVVRGESAEAVLDEHAGSRGSAHVAVQRFEEGEHVDIGDEASDDRLVELGDEDLYALPFGFIQMLAADHFESPEVIAQLAKTPGTGPQSREALEWVIYDNHLVGNLMKVMGRIKKQRPDDPLLPDLVAAVHSLHQRLGVGFSEEVTSAAGNPKDSYYTLAQTNYGHFAAPFVGDDGKESPITMSQDATGTIAKWVERAPTSAPRTYRAHHVKAIAAAVAAGAGGQSESPAMLEEGFASHFLADAFSAGHMRTARFDIQRHWNEMLPMFGENLRGCLAQMLSDGLDDKKQLLALGSPNIDLVPEEPIYHVMLDRVTSALRSFAGFSFGDLVSGVMHDYDNTHGVLVDTGTEIVELYGDGHLAEGGGKKVAVAAVAAGIADIDQAYVLGSAKKSVDEIIGILSAANNGYFAAEAMIPTALPDSVVGDDRAAPRWDYPTVGELLADAKFRDGLAITLSAKKGEFEKAISSQPRVAQAILKKRVLDRLGDEDGCIGFLDEVLDWAPQIRDASTGYDTGEAVDYVRSAALRRGGLDSLTFEARRRLLEVLVAGPSDASDAARDQVLDTAPPGERAQLVAEFGASLQQPPPADVDAGTQAAGGID